MTGDEDHLDLAGVQPDKSRENLVSRLHLVITLNRLVAHDRRAGDVPRDVVGMGRSVDRNGAANLGSGGGEGGMSVGDAARFYGEDLLLGIEG